MIGNAIHTILSDSDSSDILYNNINELDNRITYDSIINFNSVGFQ